MKNVLFIPLLALSFTFVNPCSPNSRFVNKEPKPTDRIYDVEVIYPKFNDVPRVHEVAGIFEPAEVSVVTAVGDGAVEQILVSVGDKVLKDDPLLKLSGKNLSDLAELKRLRVKELELRLKKARASFQNMAVPDRPVMQEEVDFLDEEPLDESASRRDFENTAKKEEEPSSLKGLVEVLETMIARLSKEVEILEGKIRLLAQGSPVTGVVSKIFTAEKNHVQEGDQLLEVSRLEPMLVAFDLPQDVASFVDKYSKVKVAPQDAPAIEGDGTVSFISPNVDSAKGTIQLKAELSNPDLKIKGAQQARVKIETRKVDAVMGVPLKAVVKDADKTFIYVVQGNFVKRVEARVLRDLEGGHVEIVADVRVDDPVVVNPPVDLADGAFVRPLEKEEDMQAGY
jgi:multidrug efflux pump subunit AcrA (membrane-fusion protein)